MARLSALLLALLLIAGPGCGSGANRPAPPPEPAARPLRPATDPVPDPPQEPAPQVRRLVPRSGTSCGGREESPVELALRWLTARQAEDGSWREDPGVTGLVLLAFLGAGETHRHGRYNRTVRQGLRFLTDGQGTDGAFDPDPRAHALATLAMCEDYAFTENSFLGESAQAGLDHLACRGPGGDESVPWELLALHSGRQAGLAVSDGAFAGAWLRVADPRPGAELLARILAGEDPTRDRAARWLVDEVLRGIPSVDRFEPEALAFGTWAMFQTCGEPWKTWNAALKPILTEGQVREGDESGSWPPMGGRDRLQTTALVTLCYEVYYRYPRVAGIR